MPDQQPSRILEIQDSSGQTDQIQPVKNGIFLIIIGFLNISMRQHPKFAAVTHINEEWM